MEFYAQFASESYKSERRERINDYVLTNDSNSYMCVYCCGNEFIVSFRGTAGVSDLVSDMDIMFSMGFSSRWKRSKRDFKALTDRYVDGKFTLSSHSLGAAINNLIEREFPAWVVKVCNFNCGTGLMSWVFHRRAAKAINYHILGDIISAGHLDNKVTLRKRKRGISRHSIEQFTPQT
jgi:hypothetical protein